MEDIILVEVSHDREGAKKTFIKSINTQTLLAVPGQLHPNVTEEKDGVTLKKGKEGESSRW